MCYDETEIMFAKMKKVKARKEHKCDWCPEPIKKGEEYMFFSMMYEGEFTINRDHLDCFEVQQKYWDEVNKQGGDESRFDFVLHSFKRGSTEPVEEAD